MPPSRPRILAIIQAGGAGTRMDVLTRETPKPALPFAGSYRLIDFPLSNLRNSGVSDVWLSVQYLAQDLADVTANGKPWDLDRHRGGFRLIVPQGGGSPAEEGFVSGNAEELLQNRDAIRRHGADAVVVMSADHVYRLDYREVVDAHLARDAECTVVTTEVSTQDATHHAVLSVTDDQRIDGVDYKPERATSGRVATEIFVYRPGPLVEVLEALHRELATGDEDDGSALGDFGEHLLPALIERGRTYAYPLAGYWRDLGRPEAYVSAHRELLDADLGLFDPAWPVVTNAASHQPTRMHPGALVEDSLLSAGAQIHGTVRRSVLGPGVVVEAGAVVADSVVFADVRVAAGAGVDWAIVDRDCVVGAGASVGEPRAGAVDAPVADADLTLVGRGSTVGPGVSIARGGRLEPGTTA